MKNYTRLSAFALALIFPAVLLIAIGGCSNDAQLRGDTTTATLSFTDGDGIAELTGLPVFPATLSTADTTIDIDFPVDADTDFVDLYLHIVGDTSSPIAVANGQTVTAGTTNTISLAISTAPTAGTDYFMEIIVCAAATSTCQFGVSTFTGNDTAYFDTGTGTYSTLDMANFTASNFGVAVDTGVTYPTITAQ